MISQSPSNSPDKQKATMSTDSFDNVLHTSFYGSVSHFVYLHITYLSFSFCWFFFSLGCFIRDHLVSDESLALCTTFLFAYGSDENERKH